MTQPLLTHLLFDFDGTLADSRKNIAKSLNFGFSQNNLAPVRESDVYPLIGKLDLPNTFRFFYPDLTDEKVESVITDFRSYQLENAMKELEIFPGVPETLQELSARNLSLAILTTKNSVQVTKILEMLDLKKHFSVIYGTGLAHGEKPNPSCVEYILTQLPPAQKQAVAMIGDSEVDALTAKNSKIRFIGVDYGVDPAEVLHQHGAEKVMSSFSELLELCAS